MAQVSLFLTGLKQSISPMFGVIDVHTFRPKYIQGFHFEIHIANFTSLHLHCKKEQKNWPGLENDCFNEKDKNVSFYPLTSKFLKR